MNEYFATTSTAGRLLIGLKTPPFGPWDESSERAIISRSPGVLAALLLTLVAIHAAGAFFMRELFDAGLNGLTAMPFLIGLAGLIVAAITAGHKDALAATAGVVALSVVITPLDYAFTIVAIAANAPEWTSDAVTIAATIWLAFGVWRLTRVHGRWGNRRRAMATGAALVIVAAGFFWPEVEAVAARRLADPAETAEMAALRSAFESFDGIDIPQALIDQPARIAAQVAQLSAHPNGPETLVLAIGGQGYQAIFDREARRAASVLAARGRGPALIMSNSAAQAKGGLLASPGTVSLMIDAIGKRARPGDTIVIYMTSHGGPDASIAMDGPRLDFAPLTATQLADALDRAGLSRRIVIVSACYAGSWIDALANPTTIVMAAAAADRTSFGCDDSRTYTLFGEMLLAELARRDVPLAAAFTGAQARIATSERAENITRSLPEARIGAAMQQAWRGIDNPR